MIRWVFEHVNLNARTMVSDTSRTIAYFQQGDLEDMYKLVQPKVELIAKWLEAFIQAKPFF